MTTALRMTQIITMTQDCNTGHDPLVGKQS
jgi:hypothetical protein